MSVLDCFAWDNISSLGCAAIYDVDVGKPTLFATPFGDLGQIASSHSAIQIPMFFMQEETVEKCAAMMLVRTAISNRKKIKFTLNNARHTFGKRDLKFNKCVTHNDNEIIPKNLVIAVADPELLGRYVIDNGKDPTEKGLMIFNFNAVIGYQVGTGVKSRRNKL